MEEEESELRSDWQAEARPTEAGRSAGQRNGQQKSALRAAPRVRGIEGFVERMRSGAASSAADSDGGNLQIHGHISIGGTFVKHLFDAQGAGDGDRRLHDGAVPGGLARRTHADQFGGGGAPAAPGPRGGSLREGS